MLLLIEKQQYECVVYDLTEGKITKFFAVGDLVNFVHSRCNSYNCLPYYVREVLHTAVEKFIEAKVIKHFDQGIPLFFVDDESIKQIIRFSVRLRIEKITTGTITSTFQETKV